MHCGYIILDIGHYNKLQERFLEVPDRSSFFFVIKYEIRGHFVDLHILYATLHLKSCIILTYINIKKLHCKELAVNCWIINFKWNKRYSATLLNHIYSTTFVFHTNKYNFDLNSVQGFFWNSVHILLLYQVTNLTKNRTLLRFENA